MEDDPLTLSGWAEQIGEKKLGLVLADAGICPLYFRYALSQRACLPAFYCRLCASAIRQCGVFPTFEGATIARPRDAVGRVQNDEMPNQNDQADDE